MCFPRGRIQTLLRCGQGGKDVSEAGQVPGDPVVHAVKPQKVPISGRQGTHSIRSSRPRPRSRNWEMAIARRRGWGGKDGRPLTMNLLDVRRTERGPRRDPKRRHDRCCSLSNC